MPSTTTRDRDDIKVIHDPKPSPATPLPCPVSEKLNTARPFLHLYG